MAKEKSPHRLQQEEHVHQPVAVASLSKGDVFVRHGAPCMVIEPTAPVVNVTSTDHPNHTWIVNLVTGSAWPIPNGEEVWPATAVCLKYTSARKD